jgi:hypothetical protein
MKKDRRESDKDAAVRKAVKEIFLKDKIGCNHIGTLFVTSFRHSSNQRVGMMYQWVPPKYFSTPFGKGVDRYWRPSLNGSMIHPGNGRVTSWCRAVKMRRQGKSNDKAMRGRA